jgi:hypothetical protein
MELKEKQIEELARGMVDSLRDFFNDPHNQKQYQEWHLKKYGCLPGEQVAI